MAVGTTGAGGLEPLKLQRQGAELPLKMISESQSEYTFYRFTVLHMVKLTSKVQKNVFERAKNRKKFPGGGRVPGSP